MNIFTLSDENDLSDKISLDDLFESKREYDENKLSLFNKKGSMEFIISSTGTVREVSLYRTSFFFNIFFI